jgi:hypothetical protein
MLKTMGFVVFASVMPLFVWLAAPALITSGVIGILSVPVVLAIVVSKGVSALRAQRRQRAQLGPPSSSRSRPVSLTTT